MFRARSMRTVLAMNARADIPMADIEHLSPAVQDLVTAQQLDRVQRQRSEIQGRTFPGLGRKPGDRLKYSP